MKKWIFCLMACFHCAWGWSAKGHVLESQIAWDVLSIEERRQIEPYVTEAMRHLPDYTRKKIMMRYRGASDFAKLSFIPDTWRNVTLAEIFKQFDAPLPATLKPYAEEYTNTWHYDDAPQNSFACSAIPADCAHHLGFALSVLTHAWEHTQDVRARSVLLLFIVHLIEDAQQPLHAMDKHTTERKNDHGGTHYAIFVGRARHASNLHNFWDTGMGYLNRSISSYSEWAKNLEIQFPIWKWSGDAHNLNFRNWVSENTQKEDLVYSIPEHDRITRAAVHRGQSWIQYRIVVSGYRVASSVSQLLVSSTFSF